jgi:hypothetical protein
MPVLLGMPILVAQPRFAGDRPIEQAREPDAAAEWVKKGHFGAFSDRRLKFEPASTLD